MAHSILLVDDDAFFTRMTIRALSDMDCDFTYCADGEECLEIIESQLFDYDMVFMDVHMPNLNGSDAARTIRALRQNKLQHVPIIALTGDPHWCDEERSNNAGFSGYMRKPNDMDSLKEALQSQLDLWKNKTHDAKVQLV